MYSNLVKPLEKQKGTPTYLKGQLLARGDEFPSTLVPCLGHTLDSCPLSPLFPSLSPDYTIYKDDINNHGLLRPGQ